MGGNVNTYLSGAWQSIGSLDASSELPFITNGTEQMRIKSNGYIGIGTTSPSYQLDVNGSSATYSARFSGNSIQVNGVTVLSEVMEREVIAEMEGRQRLQNYIIRLVFFLMQQEIYTFQMRLIVAYVK